MRNSWRGNSSSPGERQLRAGLELKPNPPELENHRGARPRALLPSAAPAAVCHPPAEQAALSTFPAGATHRIWQIIYSRFIFIFLRAGMRSYTEISLLGEPVSFPLQESSAPPTNERLPRTRARRGGTGTRFPSRVRIVSVPAPPPQFALLCTQCSSCARCGVVAWPFSSLQPPGMCRCQMPNKCIAL